MAVEAKLSWTQTADGSKIIFKDDSIDTGGTYNPASYTRTVQVYNNKDATGALLDTLTFTGPELTVEYDLAQDIYLSGKLTIDDGSDQSVDIINFGPTVNEYNSLSNTILSNPCGCNKDTDQSTRFGFMNLWLAEKSVIVGNSGSFNRFIEASRTWLAS